MRAKSLQERRTTRTHKSPSHRRHSTPSSITVTISPPSRSSFNRRSKGSSSLSRSHSSSSSGGRGLRKKRRSDTSSSSSEESRSYIMGFAPRSIIMRRQARRSSLTSSRRPRTRTSSMHLAPRKRRVRDPEYTRLADNWTIGGLRALATTNNLFEGVRKSSSPKKRRSVFIRIRSLAPKSGRKTKSVSRIRRSHERTSATSGLHKALLKGRYESKLARYLSSQGRIVPSAPRKRGKRDYSEFSASPTKRHLSPSYSRHVTRRRRPTTASSKQPAYVTISRLTRRSPPSTPRKSRKRQQRPEPVSPSRFGRRSSK